MKWLFYALLLANFAYLTWELAQGRPATAPVLTEVPMPAHVNRLLLLDEVNGEELRLRSDVGMNLPSEAMGAAPDLPPLLEDDTVKDPSSSRICYSVGPLSTDEQIVQVQSWLEERGAVPMVRPGERRELSLYWVHFPPFASREDAVEQVTRMKSEGLEDIYVIPGGDMRNAVSLGVFKQQSSLERRLEELRNMGYHPWVVPRSRSEKATWFDVEFGPGFAFPRDAFSESFPFAQARRSDCL